MTTDNQLIIQLPSKWLKIFGSIFIIGGIAALIVPAMAGIALELLLGWLFFAGGCIQLALAMSVRENESFWFKLMWAVLFVFVGLWLLLRPVEGIQALAFIVGVLFLVEAILKFMFFWHRRGAPKIGWILVSGIFSLIIASIIFGGWPEQSAILLGILVGFNLVASGAAVLLLGLSVVTDENTGQDGNESGSGS